MKPRLTKYESLERRQLLAGDLLAGDLALTEETSTGLGAAAITAEAGFAGLFGQTQLNSGADDWIEEDDGQLVAIRMNSPPSADALSADAPLATAFVFARNTAGELEQTGSIELSFRPERVIWTDQMLLILGSKEVAPFASPDDPETLVMSIDRDQVLDRSVTNLSGPLVSTVVDKDRLVVTTANLVSVSELDSGQTIEFPVTPYTVHLFDLSGELPEVIATGGTGGSVLAGSVVEDQMLILEPTSTLFESDAEYREVVRYRVEEGSIVREDSVVANATAKSTVHLADNGQTAVIVSVVDNSAYQNASGSRSLIINLIDTNEDELSVFETMTIDMQSPAVEYDVNESAVVIASGANEVYVVDTDQSIELNSENRVRRVPLRSLVQSFASSGLAVEALSGHLFAVARRDDPSNHVDGTPKLSETKVSLISVIDRREVAEVSVESDAAALFLDGQAEPKLLQWTDFSTETRTHVLSIIEVDPSQGMTETDQVAMRGADELDVNSDRLVVRQLDQIEEYRWDSLADPTAYPLGQPLVAPQAVDDVIEQNVDWQYPYLNVLSNDVFETPPWLAPVQITELVDAPEGVSLNDQGQLRLSGDLLESEGQFNFSYVVQQARFETSGNVTLNLVRFDDQEIADLRREVLRHAAEDLEIELSQISLGRVVAYTEIVMPEVMENGVANELGGRFGVIVEINVDGQLRRYAADFDGNIVQLDTREFETVMALSMRAVDGDGNEIEQLQTGDEFFIEVTSKDMRAFGEGVFGVAFDLPLPAAMLELTGQFEALGEWDSIGEENSLAAIDEFQAIEVLLQHPGNASQPVVRFGVKAIAGGEVQLQLDPAESFGAELLLRGRNDVVSPFEVDFGNLSLSIAGILPTDTDGNGAVTPLDALRVINFLGLHGSVSTDQLQSLFRDDAESEAAIRLTNTHRLDTNADGLISARDALGVINEIGRQFASESAEGESVAGSRLQSTVADEDDADELANEFQTRLF